VIPFSSREGFLLLKPALPNLTNLLYNVRANLSGERQMGKSLKILVVASEAVPFAKVGGLADVAGSLPKALRRLGHDAREE
jgi:hypothetical protein